MADAMPRLSNKVVMEVSVEDDIPCFTIDLVRDGKEEETKVGTILDGEKELRQVIVADDISDGVFAVEKEEYYFTNKEKILREQATYRYFMPLLQLIGQKHMQLEVYHEGYALRRSSLDGLLEKVVLDSLRQRGLHLPNKYGQEVTQEVQKCIIT